MVFAMSAGAAMTSLAAGWTMQNGAWVYLDGDGVPVYNEWRRGADNLWRYLDGYGVMALNSWVDDEYYVDENGIMVSGGWRQLSVSPNGDTSDVHWYYFQDTGKAVKNKWLKLNNRWYHFNYEGIMETGWVDDNMYFCGDDGAALTGWQRLYPPDGTDLQLDPFEETDGKVWYYFNTSGKKYVPADGSEYTEKRIDGVYYCFDDTGMMQTGWVPYNGTGDISKYRYYGSNGASVTGWYTAEPPAELMGQYESDVDWFYFARNGEPKVGPREGEASTSDFFRINGKIYLFNEKGNPVYGLQKVQEADGQYTAYYFDEKDRSAVKGKVDIEESNGIKVTYYFGSAGRGYTGVYSGSLYYMGRIQTATEGMRYETVEVNNTVYLVNEAGRVTKSTSGVKDTEGVKYITDKNGVVVKIDDSASVAGRVPDLPDWEA